ncbi:MAG: MMPL family transporter [bacterium]|nr:MMPL family transporter [bacterium]
MRRGQQALDFILRHRFWVLFFIAVLTLPAIVVLRRAEISRSIIESFVDDPQDYFDSKRLEGLFSGNPDSLIWLATTEGADLFTFAKLTAIRQAAREIEQLEAVRRVVILPDLPRPLNQFSGIRGTAAKIVLNRKLRDGEVPQLTVTMTPILSSADDTSETQLRDIADTLLDGQNYGSQLISKDTRSQVMLVELLAPYELSPAEQVNLLHKLQAIVKSHGLGESGVYCSGLIAIQAFAFEEIAFVLRTILPAGGILISLAVMYVFRRIEVILLTLVISLISIAWGISLGVLAFGKISVLMAAVPLMVLVISTADVIHLVSSYTAERGSGLTHRVALHKTFHEVGGACVLTSLTTFVGFASLIFVPSQTVRQFGFATAAGVAGALLLSVILVPIFLDSLARAQRPLTASASASRFTQAIARGCLRVGYGRPRFTLGLFAVGFVLCAAMSCRVTLDPDLARRFSPKHAMTQSTDFFQDQYGGVNSVELLLRGTQETLLAPDFFRQLRDFAELCSSEFGCERVDSVADLVASFLRQLDFRNPQGIPESRLHAQTVLEYLRQMNPDIVDRLITSGGTQARLLIQVKATSYLELLSLSEQLTEAAQRHFGADVQVTEKGSIPVVGRAIREIIRGHLQGFLFCFSTIFLLIAIGLRSWKLAALSALPNLTPLLILGGLIGLLSPQADSDLLGVATLGLGLAVDDTIHYLSRFQVERGTGQSTHRAVASAMDHTGLAIIRTTLILSVGFLPFACSSYLSVNMLGSYLIAVLMAAVLADLILLPALMRLAFEESKSHRSGQ